MKFDPPIPHQINHSEFEFDIPGFSISPFELSHHQRPRLYFLTACFCAISTTQEIKSVHHIKLKGQIVYKGIQSNLAMSVCSACMFIGHQISMSNLADNLLFLL
ncbi:hypothetical protein SLEP1_g19831 [Rubroshorea leprosula]|uniref:Uncharacterized protein n=1 Tax=Rubroshorea leprosula TaxID=152421 RepID=A0AAV5J6K1_9ROSI|nr:hypothetical protein SLEP1_g19831 [Rubroshorea leprosula]